MKKLMILIGFILIMAGCENQTQVKFEDDIKMLEEKYNTNIGVYVHDTESGKKLYYNQKEVFPFASTSKMVNSAILLNQYPIDELDKKVKIEDKQIVPYSPIVEKHIGKEMSLKELINASMTYSDNTASNLIINEIGGLEFIEKELSKLEVENVSVDRLEPELNFYSPEHNKDTITPESMGKLMYELFMNDYIGKDEKEFLVGLMINNETGDTLIKKGASQSIVADKSGQAVTYGARNDVALVFKGKNSEPIILVVYTKGDTENMKPNDQVIEETTRSVIRHF